MNRQALLVVTPDWPACDARLARCERLASSEAWRMIGPSIPVVVGRNGLGWGSGLHEPSWMGASDPVKREGDGRSPAGIFALKRAFGYEPSGPEGLRMPYQLCTRGLCCVDDPGSPFYNQLVESAPESVPAWSSAEVMRREDGLYRLGVVVGYNTDPVAPGAGSCIFLHVWNGPGLGTSGCTAMAYEDLRDLLVWLDPEACPVLIQLPQAAAQSFVGIASARPL